jgi:SPP1 family predicted phage head-tail adaptor
MDKLAAGELRDRVSLQQPTYASDTAGAVVPTFATVKTVWAKVEPLSDSMIALAAQGIGAISHRVTIRYYSGITSGWRILWGSRVFDIVGPPRNVNERDVYMELRCSETEVVT